MTVHAKYSNGVFRPIKPVDLPEDCEVVFDPRIVNGTPDSDAMRAIYEHLSHSYEGGERDTAERHNEHQP